MENTQHEEINVPQNNPPFQSKMRVTIALHYVLYAVLMGLFMYWNTNRDDGFKLSILLFQALPLLAFLPGMIQNVYRAYSWFCFILLFYFIFAVQSVFSTIREPSDYIFLSLIVLLFVTSMLASRWLQRAQKGIY